MHISFVIITNSGHEPKIINQIKSINIQSIPSHEIIISGKIPQEDKKLLRELSDNIKFVDCVDAAENGDLGAMRNHACDIASFDNLVISDNDMLFSKNWYDNLLQSDNFDILTPRVLLPDGTRFWDHCCYQSPVHGHIILNPEEKDDHLYMSGGQSWIMKKKVFEKYRWDENLRIYNMSNLNDYANGKHNEDTEYSQRCRKDFTISHNPNLIVIHNDSSYTNVGRMILRRHNKTPNTWCKDVNLPQKILQSFAATLIESRLVAEGLDLLRKIVIDYPSDSDHVQKYINSIHNQYGGKLHDSEFTFDNNIYSEILETIS